MLSNHLILCHPLVLLLSVSQHRGLFQWVSSSHQVAKVLELQLEHQSFQWFVVWCSVSSYVWLFATPWTEGHQASCPSLSPGQSKFMSIESVMLSNPLILCCLLLLLPSIFPNIRLFSREWVLHIRLPRYWSSSFCFSFSPSNVHSGLISFRINWFDPLAVQGTLKSLLQHHNSKASILQHSAFFMVQLSHWYMTTGKKHSSDYADLYW